MFLLGFSLRGSHIHLWVMWVYIVWVQKVCIRLDRLAEQNVSRVFRRKALLARYSRDTAVSIWPDSSHSGYVQGTCFLREILSHELPTKSLQSSIAWVFTHSLSLTQPLQLNPTINTGYNRLNKIIIKFGTKLKPTKHIIVNYNFTQ